MTSKHEIEWFGRKRSKHSVNARKKIVEGKGDKDAAKGCFFVLILLIGIAAIGSYFVRWASVSLILKLSAGAIVFTAIISGIMWIKGAMRIDKGREEEWIEDGGSSDEFLTKEFDKSKEQKIHFRCSNCQTKYSALFEQAGRERKCKNCGKTIVVPHLGN